MAIYSFHANIITRSKGQSSVASASYRSGEKLVDERTGEEKFYKRDVQPDTMILAPSHAPNWVQDRNRLWNEVEKSETRKNSQLARDLTIALPKELSNDQQKELIKSYIQNEFVNKGMVADIAIHRDDEGNPHAHVMLTTREISEEGFTVKNRDWNDRELLNQWREQWANYSNRELEKAGFNERITHLSHEDRGLKTLPNIHLGHVAHAMEKENKESDRGNINREINKYNENVINLQKYREEKQQIQKQIQEQKEQKSFLTPSEKADIQEATKIVKGYVTLEKIEERREQLEKWKQSVTKSESYFEWKEKAFDQARGHINKQDNIQSQIQANQNEIKNINWVNPFKLKENNQTKERCEKAIERLGRDSSYHEQKIDYYREKLGFTTKEEFFSKSKEFTSEKEQKTVENFKAKETIEKETVTLDKAEKALKQGQIREVTSQYPELKTTGEYMKYENAMKLKEINDKAGRIVPLDEIKTQINERTNYIEKGNKSLQRLESQNQKMAVAETYYKQLDQVEKKLDKIENNPFLKGKLMISKEARNEYDQLKTKQENYKSALKELGYENKGKFLMQKEIKNEKYEQELKVNVKQGIQDQQEGNAKGQNGIGLGLLENAMQGIDQAKQREERESRKQREKQLYRGQKTHELER